MLERFQTRPRFGGKLLSAEFYSQLDSVILSMRPHTTQRAIANRLNELSLTTPTGLPFNRNRLAAYIRNAKLN